MDRVAMAGHRHFRIHTDFRSAVRLTRVENSSNLQTVFSPAALTHLSLTKYMFDFYTSSTERCVYHEVGTESLNIIKIN